MRLFDLSHWLPLLLQGLYMTLAITLVSLCISLCLGILMGIIMSRKSGSRYIASCVTAITLLIRGIPFYVQLLLWYFVLPEVTYLNLSSFTAAVCALGVCSSAYVANIIRAGIDTFPQGQWEACIVLGYSWYQSMRYAVTPFIVRHMLPPLLAEIDQIIKSTAVVSSIGIIELTRAGINIIAREMNPLPIYGCIALGYLLLSGIVNVSAFLIRRKSTL